jgi:hypothetical protein
MIPNYTRTRGADIATRDTDWHTHAACIGHERTFDNADLELHTTSRKPTRDAIDDALAICGGCPVRTQCTTDALRIEQGTRSAERFSIRGGLTPIERANTKKVAA